MGNWCSSCFGVRDRSEDVEDNLQQPTERTRLLPPDVVYHEEESVPQNSHALNQLREQETLKKIVQRTADNLIDISSTRMLDRIQHEHAVERAQEYRELLKDCEPQLAKFVPKQKNPLLIAAQPTEKIPELLAGGHIKKQDIEQMTAIMDKIQAAMREMRVQPLGDIVVPLMGAA